MSGERGSQTGETPSRSTPPTGLRAFAPLGVPTPKRLAALVAAALVGTAGALWLMTQVGYGGSAELQAMVEDMKTTPQWIAWVVVLGIQTALWAALIPAVRGAIRQAEGRWTRWPTLQALVILALVFAPVLGSEMADPVHPVQEILRGRMRWLTIVGTIVGFLAVIAIVRAHEEVRKLHEDASDVSVELRVHVERYRELRTRLHFLGGALAVIVALAVLSTGGQRNTIVAMETARATKAAAGAQVLEKRADDAHGPLVTRQDCPTEGAEPTTADCLAAAAAATARAARFGVEAVWAFGLYYTFALMLIYVPSYLSLLEAGRRIRDRYRLPLPGDSDHEQNTKARAELSQVLGLEKSPLESLRAATLVLIPLLSSLASNLLGGVAVAA